MQAMASALARHGLTLSSMHAPVSRDMSSTREGGTPLVAANHLAPKLGLKNLYIKNDAVCFPSLSFKDRVVATALVAARRFKLDRGHEWRLRFY